MAVDFINDAAALVENAWDWSALRREVVVTTANGTSDYLVADSGSNSKLLYFVNDDLKQFLEYRPTAWVEERRIGDTVLQSPQYFTYYNSGDGDLRVRLWPTPDDVYALRYYAKFPQETLVDDNDVLLVPWLPVLHMALALLAREKGETGGTSVAEYFAISDRYLSDAIAYDAANHPEDLVFTVP